MSVVSSTGLLDLTSPFPAKPFESSVREISDETFEKKARGMLRLLNFKDPGLFVSAAANDGRLVREARELHALVYRRFGYVDDSALVDDGARIGHLEDPYRDSAQYFVAQRHGSTVATAARMIHADETRGFASFQTYSDGLIDESELAFVESFDAMKCVEISGLVKRSGESPLSVLRLYRTMLQYSWASGHEAWIMSCDARLFGQLSMLIGPAVRQVGPAVFYKGHYVVPAIIDIARAPQRLMLQKPSASPVESQLQSAVLSFLFAEYVAQEGYNPTLVLSDFLASEDSSEECLMVPSV